MNLYKSFEVNSKKEEKGVPVTYAPYPDGRVPTFWVARQSKSNKQYRKVVTALYKPYKREIQRGKLAPEVSEEIAEKGFIKGCLKGWEHITDKEGVDLPFSEENAFKLFSDLPDLLEDLMERAMDISNYQDDILEEDSKN